MQMIEPETLTLEFYRIISIFVTAGILLVCGLALLFASVPDRPLLSNYRKARNMMATAYLFFMIVNTTEFFLGDFDKINVSILQTITLAIAVSQALLFTMALLALLETKFPGWSFIFGKLIPASLIIIAIFVVYNLCSETVFGIAFYGFSLLYSLLLVYYTRLFLITYRRFRLQLDNYFSDNEAVRMRWIYFSFFAALMTV